MAGFDTLINLLGLPIASGINLYATILVLGLGQRFGWLQGLPDEMAIFANPIVLGVAGILYTIEFFADKIPYLDTFWDGLHTFIRPAGAAFLTMQVVGDYGPQAKVMAMFAGAVLGLGAHASKAGTRLLVNASPEPLSNSLISLAEDLGVVALVALIYTYPLAAFCVVLLLIAAMTIVAPLLFRMTRFLLAGAVGVVSASFGAKAASHSPPPDWLFARFAAFEPATKTRAYPCYARKISGAPSFQPGYLVVLSSGLHFAYRTLFRSGVLFLARSAHRRSFQERLLFDVVALDTGRGTALICVTKNWSAAVQSELGAGTAPVELVTAQNR